MTQQDRVKQRIEETGSVDNFWAFHNYILRLGAIVHGLRKGITIIIPVEI